MFLPFYVSPSYFYIEDIGQLPSMGQIFQYDELVALIAMLVTISKMGQPDHCILAVAFIGNYDLRLRFKFQFAIVSGDMLMNARERVGDVV
jgi:hypothetical protein